MDVSGGIFYHFRALRYQKTLWRPYRESLAQALLTLAPPPNTGGQLLLIGPSAGHCLPFEWLGRYQTIAACDPDPIARLWFTLRLKARAPASRLTWIDPGSLLRPSVTSKEFDGARIASQLDLLLGAARFGASLTTVFFAGILGQLPLLFPQATDHASYGRWQTSLFAVLTARGMTGLSLHDRLSAPLPLAIPPFSKFKSHVTNAKLAEYFEIPRSGPRVEPLVIHDHLTAGFSLRVPSEARYLDWQLTPGFHILMELMYAQASNAR